MNKHDVRKLIWSLLAIALIIPCIAFSIMNVNRIDALRHVDEYKSGVLKVDSVVLLKSWRARRSSYYACGHVGTVSTGTLLGAKKNARVQKLVHQFHKSGLEMPVWYRLDGLDTFNRLPKEKEFPFFREVSYVVLRFLAFQLLFVVAVVMAFRHAQKSKLLKKMEKPRERWVTD